MKQKIKLIQRQGQANVQVIFGLVIMVLASLLIGLVVGSLDAIFGRVLLYLSNLRSRYFYFFIPFLAPVGVLFMLVFQKYGGESKKGMGLVFQVGQGEAEVIPRRLIPFTVIGTWLTHLFGGSAGREGVAVQLGATVANRVGEYTPLEHRREIFLMTGMAAGFAGLFETPIAAVFFALEVLYVGRLQYSALLSAMIAAFTASEVSHRLGLEKFSKSLTPSVSIDYGLILKLIVLGILFGMIGLLFAKSLHGAKKYLAKWIRNPVLRIGVVGLFLSVTLSLAYSGRYAGLGTNLVIDSLAGDSIFPYDWLLKLIFTVLTLAVGFQGGEVTPLFAIGGSAGAIFGQMLGLPLELSVALGYASVFGSGTNTLLAPMFVGAEVFGFQTFPYFFVVCSIAYLCNQNTSIYQLQKTEKNRV